MCLRNAGVGRSSHPRRRHQATSEAAEDATCAGFGTRANYARLEDVSLWVEHSRHRATMSMLMTRVKPARRNRLVMPLHSGAAIAAMFFLSASALVAGAARPATPAISTTTRAPNTFAVKCKSLRAQWTSVFDAHQTEKHFARASKESEKGGRDCASAALAKQKSGIADYKTALKIVGVKPERRGTTKPLSSNCSRGNLALSFVRRTCKA